MSVLELQFECGEDSLSVRRFYVREGMSRLFEVGVWACSRNEDIDLEVIVGRPAALLVMHGTAHVASLGARSWAGVCNLAELVHAEPTGLSTYHLRIVPNVWLLDQRRNHRIFQHRTIPEIVTEILDEWGVPHALRLDEAGFPKLEYRVQYGEGDYAFICRMLEEAGVAYYFEDRTGTMVLRDKPQYNDLRPGCPIDFVDHPNPGVEKEFVTDVRLAHEVRPGRLKLLDHDFRRKPEIPLFADATSAPAPEDRYEQFVYLPGSFIVEGAEGGGTPVADSKSVARATEKAGKARAERSLEAQRASKRHVVFQTSCIDLAPGVILTLGRHPRPDLDKDKRLLVTEFTIDAVVNQEWHMAGAAVFADRPYRPPLRTPKPHIFSVQSAVVVGPPGEEIHTDEFGRVRVQFHWDRYGKYDDNSSCWVRVSQGWAGGGFGMITVPRVGQEVLVGFIEGNPDQPILVGRVFNGTAPVPHKLPDNKTVSTWKSSSSPGGEGFNELKFEDAAGRELVYVQAQRDLTKLVKRNETETTLVDRTATIGHDHTKLVKNEEIETTGQNRIINVGANHIINVGQNRSAQIGLTDTIVAGMSHSITVGISMQTGSSMSDKKITLTTGDATITIDGPNITLKANGNIMLQANGDITLEAKGTVTLRSTGDDVIVKGSPNVKIN